MATRYLIDTENRRSNSLLAGNPSGTRSRPGATWGTARPSGAGTGRPGSMSTAMKRYHSESFSDDMSFDRAVEVAIGWFTAAAGAEDHHYRVSDAVDDYVEHLRVNNSEEAFTGRQETPRQPPDRPDQAPPRWPPCGPLPSKRWHQSLVRQSGDPEDVRDPRTGPTNS